MMLCLRKSTFHLLFISIGCSTASKKTYNPNQQVTIMAYNVENLFDTEDDPEKEDDTFLPLSAKSRKAFREKCLKIDVPLWRDDCLNTDWNEQTLRKKMDRLSKVVRQIDNGKGPDILMLEEVENKAILERFNKEYLSDLGYTTLVLIEGWDDRAIDQGVLSRLPLSGEPILHRIPLKAKDPQKQERVENTRGILEVPLKLPDQTTLYILSVHLPSGGSSHYLRAQSVDFLKTLKQKKDPSAMIIVGGDFNINIKEDTEFKMYSEKIGQDWQVSHLIGCKKCDGTHFYGKDQTWSFLDALLFSPSLAPTAEVPGPWKVSPEEIMIANKHPLQMRKGIPARFKEGRKSRGVSDHLPIFGVIEKR